MVVFIIVLNINEKGNDINKITVAKTKKMKNINFNRNKN